MFLSAEFREPGSTAVAIEALSEAGSDKKEMDVFSTKPVEFEPGVLDRPSHMSLFTVGGAIVNAFLATAFMFWTQNDYPLVTGGMPLTSFWSVGVIIFEMAMAGAMAGAMVAFLLESRLLRGGRKPAPRLRDDAIFLRLECADDRLEPTRDLLQGLGAIEVRPLGAEA